MNNKLRDYIDDLNVRRVFANWHFTYRFNINYLVQEIIAVPEGEQSTFALVAYYDYDEDDIDKVNKALLEGIQKWIVEHSN